MFVYKYIDIKDNIVKYVGITKDLKRRIKDHKKDKWYNLSTYSIYYLEVNSRCDAEMLEGHFIALYETHRYFNVAKETWGLSSFVNDDIENKFICYNDDEEQKYVSMNDYNKLKIKFKKLQESFQSEKQIYKIMQNNLRDDIDELFSVLKKYEQIINNNMMFLCYLKSTHFRLLEKCKRTKNITTKNDMMFISSEIEKLCEVIGVDMLLFQHSNVVDFCKAIETKKFNYSLGKHINGEKFPL